ncbi:protein of unknown function [Candidatus Promineifilum breve]|uniref:Uncharacterized protein n=1 Tax=Candidatus Promineifilum breve TaxID=1806508 RepID=A0A170PFQ2_9CHLR|nr:protein of unknown function [Candidatus Promineifilum breve]
MNSLKSMGSPSLTELQFMGYAIEDVGLALF